MPDSRVVGEQGTAPGLRSWSAPVTATASVPISWLRDLAALSWSLTTTTAAVGLGVAAVDGVRAGHLGPLAGALAAVTVLDALAQPVLRRVAAFGSVILALVLGFGFQVLLVVAALRFTPGLSSAGWRDSLAVLLIAAAVLAATRWVLGSSDTSYVVGHALRRGGARGVRRRRPDAGGDPGPPPRRGLLVVQLDGVSPGVLRTCLAAGLAPNLARWLGEDSHRLAAWWVPVPCTTPAAMAGIMHGDRDQIPAFRWWDRDLGRLLVTNRPGDAAVVEQRLTPGRGLLRGGGVAVSTMFSGEADDTLLVMSRAANSRGLGSGSAFVPFFASLSLVPASVLLSLGEVVKELHQARRQRVRGVEPRVRRRAAFVLARGISNVLLRRLNLTLVVEQMTRGAPVIYVDMVDYDEIAHHAGPLRPEALRALEGLDAVLGRLQQVARMVDTAYELVVISDHGQSLGASFEQVSGRPLAEVVRRLMRADALAVVQAEAGEEWGPLNTLIASALSGLGRQDRLLLGPDRAPRPARPPRLLHPPGRARGDAALPGAPSGALPDLAVIGSGNLGMIWFPQAGEHLLLEEIESGWPGLVAGLLLTPGIGLVAARTGAGGIVLGPAGALHLETGAVEGADPLAPYPARAAADLRRLTALATCGDLVLISSVQPDGQVHAFESLVGSHGGLGGEQNEALLIHPAAWRIDEDLLEPVDGVAMLVGGWAVHEQLLRWRAGLAALDAGADADGRGTS